MAEASIDNLTELENITRPVIKWLNDNYHPRVTLIITPGCAELVEGICSFPTTDYIKD